MVRRVWAPELVNYYTLLKSDKLIVGFLTGKMTVYIPAVLTLRTPSLSQVHFIFLTKVRTNEL